MSSNQLTASPELVDALMDLVMADNADVAAIKSQLDEVGAKMAAKAINTHSDKFNMTPFYAACHYGPMGSNSRLKIVQLMLQSGAKVNQRGDKANNTPLHAAARFLRFKIVVLLRRYSAGLYLLNDKRQTPQQLALHAVDDIPVEQVLVTHRYLCVMTYKVMRGVISEEHTEPFGEEDLEEAFIAIQREDNEVLQAIVRNNPQKVNSYLSDDIRWTPLHLAVATGNLGAVKILMSVPDVNPNVTDDDSWCPIHWVMIQRCVYPQAEAVCQELLRLLESVPGQKLRHWARVANSTLLEHPLLGACFVTEVAPDCKARTAEPRRYVFFILRREATEEIGEERYTAMMWFDGNPGEEVICSFMPQQNRVINFRRRGQNEPILLEKSRTVFFDDLNGVISLQPQQLALNSAKYAWTRQGMADGEKDWALRRVPTLLDEYHKSMVNKELVHAIDSYQFRFSRIERITPVSETYAIEVLEETGMWMLTVQRENLHKAGISAEFRTVISLKRDANTVAQCNIDGVMVTQKKRGGNPTLAPIRSVCTGPTVLHWCAEFAIHQWFKMLLDRPDANPFDGGDDGMSPYLITLRRIKDLEDSSRLLKAQTDVRDDDDEEALNSGRLYETVIEQTKACRSVLESIRSNKKCTDRVVKELAEMMQGRTTKTPSLPYMLYALELPDDIILDAQYLLGLLSQEAKIFLLHNAVAIGDSAHIRRIVKLNKISKEDVDVGRTATHTNKDGKKNRVREFGVGVASRNGRLDTLKYLVDDVKADMSVGKNCVLREAMRAGDVSVADWILERQGGSEKAKGLTGTGCLPSAFDVEGAAEGNLNVIPRVEELQFCTTQGLVSESYLENVLMRSFQWPEDEQGSSVRGSSTALVLMGMQNDFFEPTDATPNGERPRAVVPGAGDAYLRRLRDFLRNAMFRKLNAKVDHIIIVANWHPDNHCSFREAPLVRDALTGEDPRRCEPHCIQDTWGAEVHPSVIEIIGDVAKYCRAGTDYSVDTQSAFFESNQQSRTALHELLQSLNVSRIICAGLPLEEAVANTAADALFLGYDVTVVEDLCLRRSSHEHDDLRAELYRRGARVIRERTLRISTKNDEGEKSRDMPLSQVRAIRYLLNVPNLRYYVIFEKGLYAKNLRELLNGFDFGSGDRSGELFLYLAQMSSARANTFPKGFTIEGNRFESGDFLALRYPIHYLLMRCKYAPTGMERRAAKGLLLKVVGFINSTPKVPIDSAGDPMIRFPSNMSPREFASFFPRAPCRKRFDEMIEQGQLCKCIFHVPLRTYKPRAGENEWMRAEVSQWDLWNEDFFKNTDFNMKDPLLDARIDRPVCPVGMRRHICPEVPHDEREDNKVAKAYGPNPPIELQHILCCPPLFLAVRLNLFDIVEAIICNKASSGITVVESRRGKDNTGETFAYDELEDCWQTIPYINKGDGTAIQSGTPALHYALRAMRQPMDMEQTESLRGALLGCTVGKPGGRKERSVNEFMKVVLKRFTHDSEDDDSMGKSRGSIASFETPNQDDDDDDDEAPIPMQDVPRDIAKGTAPRFFAGTAVPAWNIEEPLEMERYQMLYQDQFTLRQSEEERRLKWAIPTERQWLCPDCGCVGAEVVPGGSSSNNDFDMVRELLEYLCALRVCNNLLTCCSMYTRTVERAGEAVSFIRIDLGPRKQRLIGSMFDRAGVFEVSGSRWVESLSKVQAGDSGLSLLLQYAPQLMDQVRRLNLFEKCPYESYDELNNLVINSNSAVLVQRRHLWKSSRGGVELFVYDKGLSLLHWAALLNDDQFAKLLITWGANPLSTPLTIRLGYSPVHYTCYSAGIDVMRLIVDNVKEEHSAETAEEYVNTQAMPRVIDEGFLTYNQIYVSPPMQLIYGWPSTIREQCLDDRRVDPSAWPNASRLAQIKKDTPYKFYGCVNSAGETAMHVAAGFCHPMCIQELIETYGANPDLRTSLEGFDAHDVAISLMHRAEMQEREDNMIQRVKSVQTRENEERDQKTLTEMVKYMHEQETIQSKLKKFSWQYFARDTWLYIIFVLAITLFGFLLMDEPELGGLYFPTQAVRDSVMGEEFKLNFAMGTLPAAVEGPNLGTQWRANSEDIGEVEDVVGWIQGPLRQKFFRLEAGENETSPFAIEGKYRLAGAVRISAIRVTNDSCTIPDAYKAHITTCYGQLRSGDIVKETKHTPAGEDGGPWDFPYGEWQGRHHLWDSKVGMWVSWQSWVTGNYYPAHRGNYLDIPAGATRAEIDEKFASVVGLMDGEMRFGAVVVNLYAVNLQRFVVCEIFFESPTEGAVHVTHRFTTVRLDRYESGLDNFRFALEIIILMFMLYFLNEEIVELTYMYRRIRVRIRLLNAANAEAENERRYFAVVEEAWEGTGQVVRPGSNISYRAFTGLMKHGVPVDTLKQGSVSYRTSAFDSNGGLNHMYVCPARLRGTVQTPAVKKMWIVIEEVVGHYSSDWNIVDFVVLVMLIVGVAFHATTLALEKDIGPDVLDDNSHFIKEMPEIAQFTTLESRVLAFVVLASWVKLLKFVRNLPDMGPIAAAIVGTVGSRQISTFLVVLILVVLGLVFSCYFAFQMNLEGVATLRSAFFFVIRMVVGDADFDALQQGDFHFGPFIWFVTIFFVVIMLLNILIAVIGNVYDELVAQSVEDWSMEIAEKYREDHLGLPSLERPQGSLFVQQIYRLFGICVPRARRIYQRNRFEPISQEARATREKEIDWYCMPHIRNWDCVSTTVVERMEEYNRRQNLSNEDLLSEMDNTRNWLEIRMKDIESLVEGQLSQARQEREGMQQAINSLLKAMEKATTKK
eukprot:PhM_4_TR16111/c0_g1_i1/m.84879